MQEQSLTGKGCARLGVHSHRLPPPAQPGLKLPEVVLRCPYNLRIRDPYLPTHDAVRGVEQGVHGAST